MAVNLKLRTRHRAPDIRVVCARCSPRLNWRFPDSVAGRRLAQSVQSRHFRWHAEQAEAERARRIDSERLRRSSRDV